MNFLNCTTNTLIYDITCTNDMGHFNFYYNNTDKSNNSIITKYVFDHIYKNYVDSYYIKHNSKLVTMHYKLKPNMKNNWTYKFLHNNNIYILKITFNLA